MFAAEEEFDGSLEEFFEPRSAYELVEAGVVSCCEDKHVSELTRGIRVSRYRSIGERRGTYACAVPKMLVTTRRSSMPSKASVLRMADSMQTAHARRSLDGRSRRLTFGGVQPAAGVLP